ncbi:beta-ketoacyl synthase N-terminal-like domain-containing protein [Utexia brackfieldae]|uniref:beta-ketoacyl synthase N-terminal-like domain-containing protein n=1 Tax=Utexia brackfieldae TaxID=3074108 RepID=UPI00370D2204
MNNVAMLTGYDLCLAYAKDYEQLISHLKQSKVADKTNWFGSDRAVKQFGLAVNQPVAKFSDERYDVFAMICQIIDNTLRRAGVAKSALASKNVRVYLTGLGPRADAMDYAAFYDHSDVEDMKRQSGLKNLHTTKISQDKLAAQLVKAYQLRYLPPNIDCASNSSLTGVHLAIQGVEKGGLDLVLVVNCSQIKTQDVNFMGVRLKLDNDTAVQPFGKENNNVFGSEGFSAVLFENQAHFNARQGQEGVKLVSAFMQNSVSRGNDMPQFTASLLKVIHKSMAMANVTLNDLCAIIPHGNGSQISDKPEINALVPLLSDKTVPVLLYKALMGYTATGSGIIDLIIGYHSLRQRELISPHSYAEINEGMVPHVLVNQGVIKHDKKYLLKYGLGLDGSLVSIVMFDRDIE